MTDSSTDSRVDADQLEELLAECLERMAADGPHVLDEICSAHPDYAAELRREVDSASELGLLQLPRNDDAIPERLGDFRLIRRLGSGGMGVVYLAEQEGLGRRVAVKLIRPEQLYFPRVRERFRREAAAAARLQHPGIVPIYTVGEEGGVPHIAMEYIEGVSLDVLLRELSGRTPGELGGKELALAFARHDPAGRSAEEIRQAAGAQLDGGWVDIAANLIRQVTDALDHAHARGILHRDVKPSNLMVTANARVLLLDFGLARDDANVPVTRTGQQPGSLPYMAPEQIEGGDVDQRTDVYALGVTLYEALSLEAPYGGRTGEETRRRILEGRPRPLRSINARVSWELETVCLTALDPSPRRRYATVADFGRDLGNVIARRPIEARRPGIGRRVARWVQRHPAAAAAVFLAFVAFVVGPLTLAVRESAARHRIERESRQKEAAQRQAELEATNARETVKLLTEILESSDPWTWANKGLDQRVRVEAEASRIIEALDGKPDLQGPLLLTLGRVCARLGLADLAEPLLVRSVEQARQTGASPDQMRARLKALGFLYIDQARLADAEEPLDEALRICREHFPNSEMMLEVGSMLAIVLTRRGELDRAEELVALLEPMCRSSAEVDPIAAANAEGKLARALQECGQVDEAVDLLEHVLEVYRRHAPHNDVSHGRALDSLARALEKAGDRAGAIARSREAMAIFGRRLHPDHPEMALVKSNLGVFLFRAGRPEEAEPYLAESYARLEETGTFVDWLPEVAYTLGVLRERTNELDEADELLERAHELLVQLGRGRRPGAANVLHHRGRVLRVMGELDEARRLFEEALAIRREALPSDLTSLANIWWDLAVLESAAERRDEAIAAYRKALDGYRRDESQRRFAAQVARSLFRELRRAERLAEAAEVGAEALDRIRAEKRTPASRWLYAQLTELGEVEAALGRHADAARRYEEAAALDLSPPGRGGLSRMRVLGRAGTSWFRAGELEKALDRLERAADLAMATDTVDAAERGRMLRNAAEVALRLKRFELAERRLLESLRLARSGAEGLDATKRQLVRLYESWEKPERAAAYR